MTVNLHEYEFMYSRAEETVVEKNWRKEGKRGG